MQQVRGRKTDMIGGRALVYFVMQNKMQLRTKTGQFWHDEDRIFLDQCEFSRLWQKQLLI